MAKKKMRKKLEEIAFFTPRPKQLVSFYRRFLGIEPSREFEGGGEFMLGGVKIFIHQKNKRDENPPPDWPPGTDHVSFEVDDVDAACDELRSLGFTVEWSPKDFYWGRSAYLRDPDGRLLELHRKH